MIFEWMIKKSSRLVSGINRLLSVFFKNYKYRQWWDLRASAQDFFQRNPLHRYGDVLTNAKLTPGQNSIPDKRLSGFIIDDQSNQSVQYIFRYSVAN